MDTVGLNAPGHVDCRCRDIGGGCGAQVHAPSIRDDLTGLRNQGAGLGRVRRGHADGQKVVPGQIYGYLLARGEAGPSLRCHDQAVVGDVPPDQRHGAARPHLDASVVGDIGRASVAEEGAPARKELGVGKI